MQVSWCEQNRTGVCEQNRTARHDCKLLSRSALSRHTWPGMLAQQESGHARGHAPAVSSPKRKIPGGFGGTESPKWLLLRHYCLIVAILLRMSGFARTPMSAFARTQNSGFESYTTPAQGRLTLQVVRLGLAHFQSPIRPPKSPSRRTRENPVRPCGSDLGGGSCQAARWRRIVSTGRGLLSSEALATLGRGG